MLSELKVKNYALIKNLVFAPESNFNVITGETGAGKSIILGALGLILGERSDNISIAENEEKCVIEGFFKIKNYKLNKWFEENEFDYSDELILRREISLNGRSRAFVNDTPAQLSQLKDLGKMLIDIHSQHQNLDLFQKAFQFKVIDSFSSTLNVQDEYFEHYKELKNLKKKLEQIIDAEKQIADEKDYKQYLLDELNASNIKENEIENLEEEYKILSNAEENLKLLAEIDNILNIADFAVIEQISETRNLIKNIAKTDHRFDDFMQRADSVYYSLKELISDIDKIASQITIDPQRIEELNQRISLLHNLSQKHKDTDLIEVKLRLESDLDKYSNLDYEKNELLLKISDLQNKCVNLADKLSKARKENISDLENIINAMIESLGMKGATIKIDLTENTLGELGVFGFNDTNFLLSSSKGKLHNPIQNIASGGEISRLMFVLKTIIAEKTVMPTIIFDEIDTGISGDTALKTAGLMKKMANRTQMIVITHLPQIAASGNCHFFVYKKNENEKTITEIKKLTNLERVSVIAEMIGGKNYSSSIYEGAKQMIG